MIYNSFVHRRLIERIRGEFGLTGPWWAQYGAFFLSLCRGNFGRSLWLQQDALRVILERLPATLELAVTALVLATGGAARGSAADEIPPHY